MTVTELREALQALEAQGMGDAPTWVDDGDDLWRPIYHVGTQRNSQATVCAILDVRELGPVRIRCGRAWSTPTSPAIADNEAAEVRRAMENLTAQRVREMAITAIQVREQLILMGIATHEYCEGGLEADYALNRAAHEIAVAAGHLARLERHLTNVQSGRTHS